MDFIVFLAFVGGIIFLVKSHKNQVKKKKTDELKETAGYEMAILIKDKLQEEGYLVGDLDVRTIEDSMWGTMGNFTIFDSMKTSIGYMQISLTTKGIKAALEVQRNQRMLGYGEGYIICCANTGIFIKSSNDHKFLKICDQVIKDSKYEFEHPQEYYQYPEMRKYLNVMF
ncbi:MAG: hypothetical protein FWG98_00085 [Candidatus Cloacimonetes bacterium]|nr:hypothetical protein [Candidatus Cloacimonadota bacterium]